MEFRTIVADPPWDYDGDKKRHPGRSPRKLPSDYYPCIKMSRLIEMDVESLAAKNSHIYIWCTVAFVEEAHQLARAWGFSPKSVLTWAKESYGVGWYFRGQTEHLVFGIRGSLPIDRSVRVSTLFTAPKLRHSEKPLIAYKIIEHVSPGPRLELFARQPRDGWSVWGNEVQNDVELIVPS